MSDVPQDRSIAALSLLQAQADAFILLRKSIKNAARADCKKHKMPYKGKLSWRDSFRQQVEKKEAELIAFAIKHGLCGNLKKAIQDFKKNRLKLTPP